MLPSIRVLHVDDEPDFAELVSEFLQRKDDHIEVETETHAEDALERLKYDDIDCVVSDYDMPKMDGLELLEELRDHYPGLPFILFTGKGSEEVASEAISAGATDYLRKTSGTEKYELLANRVRNAVEQHRSERRAAELRRNERRFEAVFEDPNMLVGLLDADGTVLKINSTAMEYTEAEVDEVIGEPFWETPWWQVDEELRAEARRWTERAAEGEYVEIEAEHVRPDGEKATVSGVFRPVTEDGEVTSIVASARDITERKERERMLQRRNETLEEVASFLSHDMRTPLTTIRGRLDLAAETGEMKHVEEALTALDRTEELLTDMTDVLRTGEVVSETEEINLEETTESVLDTVNSSENLSLDVVGIPTVQGDKDAMRRMLENLFSNSVEHSEDDTDVRVGETDEGFYYEDDGPGIPEGKQEDVFKPGFTTKKGAAGTGMGLASVRQIVRAHGWEIDIEDAKNLDGARFEVRTEG